MCRWYVSPHQHDQEAGLCVDGMCSKKQPISGVSGILLQEAAHLWGVWDSPPRSSPFVGCLRMQGPCTTKQGLYVEPEMCYKAGTMCGVRYVLQSRVRVLCQICATKQGPCVMSDVHRVTLSLRYMECREQPTEEAI